MVGPQTKTAPADEIPLTLEQISAFEGGAAYFNRGEYFEAHEFWEKGWHRLSPSHRPQVQAAILTCGFFVLIRKGRLDPAVRLAKLAIERFAEAATVSKLYGKEKILDLPGAENRILRIMAAIRLGEKDSAVLLSEVSQLHANVHPDEKPPLE